jgi:hypothetical protein
MFFQTETNGIFSLRSAQTEYGHKHFPFRRIPNVLSARLNWTEREVHLCLILRLKMSGPMLIFLETE